MNVPIECQLDLSMCGCVNREKWLTNVERKFSREFADRCRELSESDDSNAAARRGIMEQVIMELQPLLSREAVFLYVAREYGDEYEEELERFGSLPDRIGPIEALNQIRAVLRIYNHPLRESRHPYLDIYAWNRAYDEQGR